MAPRRKVSATQMEILLTTLERNPEMVTGFANSTAQGKYTLEQIWETLVRRLNAVPMGDTKSKHKWRAYWNELKYSVRKKAGKLRNQVSGTGLPPFSTPFTQNEARIFNILGGEEAVFGEQNREFRVTFDGKAPPMSREETSLLIKLVNSKKVITAKETNAATNKRKEIAWIALTDEYNDAAGSLLYRTTAQLRLKWENLKKMARKRASIRQKNGDSHKGSLDEIVDKVVQVLESSGLGLGEHTEGRHASNLKSHLAVKHLDEYKVVDIINSDRQKGETSADENTAPTSFAKPKAKNRSFFRKVRSHCVDLIVKHGRPAELLDDIAFKDILNLIPLTKQERTKLSSEAIREFIETSGDDARSCEESFQDDPDDDDDYRGDDDMEMENAPIKRKVKNEKEDCSCPARDSAIHEPGCPSAAQDTYWQYFEVSIDEATCKLCSNVIKWSSMSDLKVHLTINHPTVEFKDDDDEFTTDRARRDSDGGGSLPDQTMEEIYLEEDLFQPSTRPPPAGAAHPPSAAKKRKYFPPPPSAVVTLKNNESIGMERFKSLDRFGLYVASLMKLLPLEKSLKYQEQIIQRLIREQAAAG